MTPTYPMLFPREPSDAIPGHYRYAGIYLGRRGSALDCADIILRAGEGEFVMCLIAASETDPSMPGWVYLWLVQEGSPMHKALSRDIFNVFSGRGPVSTILSFHASDVYDIDLPMACLQPLLHPEPTP